MTRHRAPNDTAPIYLLFHVHYYDDSEHSLLMFVALTLIHDLFLCMMTALLHRHATTIMVAIGLMLLPIGCAIMSIIVMLYTWHKSGRPILHYTRQSSSPFGALHPTSTTPVGPPGLMATPPIMAALVTDPGFLYRIRSYRPPWYIHRSIDHRLTFDDDGCVDLLGG